MIGLITTKQLFHFPDSPLSQLPAQLRVVSAQNGQIGIQILFACDAPQGVVRCTAEGFDPAAHPNLTRAVASGNAVRKNPVLRRVLSDAFSMPLQLPIQQEEAALGAALFGGMCAGVLTYHQAKSLIRYEPA